MRTTLKASIICDMKLLSRFFLFFLLLPLAACIKENNTVPTVTLPTGTFSGVFMRIRLEPGTVKYDTVTANLQLALSQASGFAVTGDTSTVHAGSYGGYAANAFYIQFVDKTYNPNVPSVKYHLEGIYNYAYNGSNLLIYVNYADTLSLQYHFTKTN
jgi:hypothetical protein